MQELSFQQLGVAMALIFSLVGVGANLAVILSVRRTQKREVSFTAEFATKEELLDLKHSVEHINQDLQNFKTTVIENGEERKNFIVAHVDEVRRELKEDLKVVHGRVDGLPDRIIATLKNTGAIE